jgi:hypothetical protein
MLMSCYLLLYPKFSIICGYGSEFHVLLALLLVFRLH